MKLLKSIPIPGTIEKSVAALGNLSYCNRYVAVSLTDATVHIFSRLNASHLFSFKDPSGELRLSTYYYRQYNNHWKQGWIVEGMVYSREVKETSSVPISRQPRP